MLAVSEPGASKKMGRPLKEINKVELIKLFHLHESLQGIATFFGCGESTITRFCKKEFGCTFDEISRFYRSQTKTNLKAKAIDLAYKGDKDMLKLLLKNWTDIKDTQHVESKETKEIKVTVDALKEAISMDPMLEVDVKELEAAKADDDGN